MPPTQQRQAPIVGAMIFRLFLALAAFMVGLGGLNTHLALTLGSEGYTSAAAGSVQAMYYLGMVLGAFAITWLLRRRESLFVVAACTAASGLLALLHVVSPGLVGWAVLRLLSGFLVAGVVVTTESALNDAVTNQWRGRAFSILQIVTYSALAAGQLVVGLANHAGTDAFIAVAVLFASSAAVAAVPLRSARADGGRKAPTEAQTTVGARPPSPGWQALRGTASFGIFASAVSGVLLASFYTVYPLIANRLLEDVAAAGDHLSIIFICAMLVQWPIAYCSDRFGRPLTLALVSVAILAALVVLAAHPTLALVRSVGLVYAALIFVVYALGVADVNDRVAQHDRVRSATALLAIFALGGCAGSLVAAWAFEQNGARGYFAAMALTTSLLASISIATVLARRAAGVPVRCR